ncbi:MAG: LysR substrate-binding domain-containing protein [Methyloceanibacter sp.]|nr:LysR substrate-binding domain-containing protein [Methyloceanibacter sp.]
MIIGDLADARILVELHNRLSFAETAKALGIPPATVSRRLMRMEARAGLRLFDRTTRSVKPSDAGSLAASHANRMLAEVEAVDLSLSSMRDAPVGTVRMTTPTIFGQALLGPAVTAFLDENPNCDLHIDLTDKHSNLVEDGYDVAIRVGPPLDETLVATPMGAVRAALYRRTEAPEVSLEALEDNPMVLLHQGNGPRPTLQLISVRGEKRLLSVKSRLVCMNPWLLRDAALSSDVIAVLPELVAAPDVQAGRLVQVAPGWFARQVPVYLVFQSNRLMRPAVRAFIETATLRIPSLIARTQGS